ncbi:autophagy protein 5-like [Schistocerca piceifrons]|uniref:autophagy protein 5-like n=1 Tax=Schistocerca piceifrons TaxID=274613 RepID=UPI001F5E73AB|nr:autophagy protein 5-like [Schistocerca piceifrons]
MNQYIEQESAFIEEKLKQNDNQMQEHFSNVDYKINIVSHDIQIFESRLSDVDSAMVHQVNSSFVPSYNLLLKYYPGDFKMHPVDFIWKALDEEHTYKNPHNTNGNQSGGSDNHNEQIFHNRHRRKYHNNQNNWNGNRKNNHNSHNQENQQFLHLRPVKWRTLIEFMTKQL